MRDDSVPLSKNGGRLFYPVEAHRTSKQITRQIEAMIRDGRLGPGHKLPGERALADQFGTSRNPVREALRALEAVGYITVKPGKGAFVVGINGQGAGPSSMREHVQARKEQVVEYFEVHRALFAEAASLAAERLQPGDLERLEDSLREQEIAVEAEDKTGILYADRTFTRVVAEVARNGPLLAMVLASIDYLKRSRFTLFALPSVRRARKSLHEHRKILEALRARDAEKAAQTARDHVMRAMTDWSSFLETNEQS